MVAPVRFSILLNQFFFKLSLKHLDFVLQAKVSFLVSLDLFPRWDLHLKTQVVLVLGHVKVATSALVHRLDNQLRAHCLRHQLLKRLWVKSQSLLVFVVELLWSSYGF